MTDYKHIDQVEFPEKAQMSFIHGEPIYFEGDYEVYLGYSADHQKQAYLVRNKVTEVIELESRMLPEAINLCRDISSHLIDVQGAETKAKTAIELN